MNEQVKNYQKIKVQTASPAQLIFMLYDGALRFMNQAIEAIDAKHIENQNRHLTRSQRIISELQVSLDLQQGGQIAQNLNSLYDYIYRRLIQANLESDRKPVEECVKLVGDLKEAWTAVMARETGMKKEMMTAPQGPPSQKQGGTLDIAC